MECGNPETILPLQGKVWLEAHTHKYTHTFMLIEKETENERKERMAETHRRTGGPRQHVS